MKKIVLALVMVLGVSSQAMAWDGYDYNKNSYVEIDKGNTVRQGETIDYYDYSSGEYKYGDVTDIQRYGSTVEVEVYDYSSGEYRTFDMDGSQQ